MVSREGGQGSIHVLSEPVVCLLLHDAVQRGRRRSLSTSTARCEYVVLPQHAYTRWRNPWLAPLEGPTCTGYMTGARMSPSTSLRLTLASETRLLR